MPCGGMFGGCNFIGTTAQQTAGGWRDNVGLAGIAAILQYAFHLRGGNTRFDHVDSATHTH